jgi:hypothetical protein
MADDDAPADRGTLIAVGERLRDVTAVLGVAAVVLFAVLRFAYERFYSPLGLSPDDLGLGYVDLLSRSSGLLGISVVFAVLFATVVFGAISLGLFAVKGASPSSRPVRPSVVRISTGALIAVAVYAGAEVGGPAGRRTVELVVFAFIAATFLALLKTGTPAWRRERLGDLVQVAAVSAAFGLLLGAGLVNLVAAEDGDDARAGLSPDSSWGGWRADAATISWTTADVDARLRSRAATCVMYLGTANGTVFVYRPSRTGGTSLRLPASAVAVEVHPKADCVDGTPRPSTG